MTDEQERNYKDPIRDKLSGLVAAAQKLQTVARNERRGAVVDKIQDMAMDIWALANGIEKDIIQCKGSIGVTPFGGEIKQVQCKSPSIPGEPLCPIHDHYDNVEFSSVITEDLGGPTWLKK